MLDQAEPHPQPGMTQENLASPSIRGQVLPNPLESEHLDVPGGTGRHVVHGQAEVVQ
jgi:hypothetical protein